MITTKSELNHYILEDAKANDIKIGFSYLMKLFGSSAI